MKTALLVKYTSLSLILIVTPVIVFFGLRFDSKQQQKPITADYIQQEELTSDLPPHRDSTKQEEQRKNSKTARNKGYVLILKGKQQITSGVIALLSQSCLFRNINKNIDMVVPYIDTSLLGFSPLLNKNAPLKKSASQLSLFDTYDRKELEAIFAAEDLAHLADFSTFLKKAPRDIILVINSFSPTKTEHPTLEEINKVFQPQGFQVIKVVRLNFQNTGRLSLNDFKEKIYENSDPVNVTVMIDNFGPVLDISRPPDSLYESIDTPCMSRFNKYLAHFTPSPLIKKYTQAYIKKHLNQPYISVMFRTQHMINPYDSTEKQKAIINRCITDTLTQLNTLKNKHNINSVFVSLDIGRHGSIDQSNKSGSKTAVNIRKNVKSLIPSAYNDETTFEEWENSFDAVTGPAPSGFTAILQKNIAISGECLILAGGGSFQEQAINLYTSKKESNDCIIPLVESCQ